MVLYQLIREIHNHYLNPLNDKEINVNDTIIPLKSIRVRAAYIKTIDEEIWESHYLWVIITRSVLGRKASEFSKMSDNPVWTENGTYWQFILLPMPCKVRTQMYLLNETCPWICGHAEALDNNRNFNKRIQQCGREGEGERERTWTAPSPKREWQRARKRELGASEKARGRGEAISRNFYYVILAIWHVFFSLSFRFATISQAQSVQAWEKAWSRSIRYYSLSNTQPCRNRCTTWSKNLCEAFKWRRPYPYRDPRTPRTQ